MMFLQYGIWGAWLPILLPFLAGYRHFEGFEIGTMFMVGAVGALVAPFVAGQIADRYFNTEKFLGISHLLGAVLIWQLAWIESYWGFLVFSLVYSIIYTPTLSLTNSLSFHHLPDRDRDFGKVRVWGTIGWIVVGVGIGHWLGLMHTISNDEAARQVARQKLGDAESREQLLTRSQVTLTNFERPVGRIVEQNEQQIVLEMESKNDDGEMELSTKEIPREDIDSIKLLYVAIAADGKEDEIKQAIATLDENDTEETRASVIDQLVADHVFNKTALAGPIETGWDAGRADAFRLSAILGAVMGIFCFLLPATPPQPGKQASATAEALKEIRRNPLITLFLLAVPISCIHQFYFVYASQFVSTFQAKGLGDVNEVINRVLGVGGGGLMTVGQMSEIFVLMLIPLVAKKVSRKSLLAVGIVAYALRMYLFANVEPIQAYTGFPVMAILVAGIALHGLCFGCFIFVAYMIVDEEMTGDVRASGQTLFNLVIIGVGIIVGSYLATTVIPAMATLEDGTLSYPRLFNVPMWAAIVCLAILFVFYPGGRRRVRETPAE